MVLEGGKLGLSTFSLKLFIRLFCPGNAKRKRFGSFNLPSQAPLRREDGHKDQELCPLERKH